MSRSIKIPFPDISYFEKTRIVGETAEQLQVDKGASSLFFRNPIGFSIGDFFVLEAFESEDAEICEVKAVDRENHLIDINGQTYQDHNIGIIIIKTPFNKVIIYKGTTSTISTHTMLTVVDLRPDSSYTVYTDQSGLSTNYYSYKYLKDNGTTPILGILSTPPTTPALGDRYIVGPSATGAWAGRDGDIAVCTNATGPVWAFSTPTYGSQTLFAESDYNAVLTVDQLKNWFMFGLDLTDDDGYPFPNSMFECAIRAAIDSLEKVIGIRIKPTHIIGERQDYYRQDYLDFAFIQLNEYPIFDITKVALRYPTAGSDITFPAEWYQINKAHGQVHLIPTSGSLSQIMMGQGGDYLTFVWKGWEWMPNLWIIDYWAGFPPTDHVYVSTQAAANPPPQTGVPNDIIGIIGKMACFYPLNIAGDLVGGIAIASKSIGIDGLSQSINTTSSPENAGYSARLRQYQAELKIEVPRLIAFFKGLRMAVC